SRHSARSNASILPAMPVAFLLCLYVPSRSVIKLRGIVTHSFPASLAHREDCLLDIAQTVLAKKDLVADEEGGRAERAALDRALVIGEQPSLDRGVLHQFAEPLGIKTRVEKRRLPHCSIVELLGL